MPQSQKGKYSSRLSNEKNLGKPESFRGNDNFFRMMVESLEENCLFTTDTAGNVSSWNTGSEKLFGYKEGEVIGKNFSLIFTAEDIKKSVPEKELKEVKKSGRLIEEREQIKKNGSIFWASGLVYPLKDKGGGAQRFHFYFS